MSSENGYLDNLIYSTIRNELSFSKIGTRFIANRFDELGITLTDSQIEKLTKDLDDENFDNLSIDLSDEQEQKLKAVQESTTIEIDFDDLDLDNFDIEKVISQTVPDILQTVSVSLLKGWKSEAKNYLQNKTVNVFNLTRKFVRLGEMHLTYLKC